MSNTVLAANGATTHGTAPAIAQPALSIQGSPTPATDVLAPATPPPDLPPPIRFGLCGATGGGKTTFLASMSIAVSSVDAGHGRWHIVAADPKSNDFLVQKTEDMVVRRTFPQATVDGSALSWLVYGSNPGHRRLGLGRHRDRVSFTLDVEDMPGEYFLLDRNNGIPMPEESLERLTNADALVLLFDPLRELLRDENAMSNWEYFHRLLRTVQMRRAQRPGGLRDGALPHHVAMCVTKFDEPQIFARAFAERMIDIDEGGQPRVPAERAEDFFNWICGWIDQHRNDGGSKHLRDQVRNSFEPDRVRYYASSSIGFLANRGVFDPLDYQNVEPVNNTWRLRGEVRPINVLEPFIDLEHKIRKGSWR